MRYIIIAVMFISSLRLFGQQADSLKSEEIFIKVETQPKYPGGMQALYTHLGKNLRYPADARQSGTEGRIYIEFIVNEDGSTDNHRVVKGVMKSLDEEALRVIKTLSNFIPGTQNGEAVKVKMVMPVYFKLANSRPKKKKKKKRN